MSTESLPEYRVQARNTSAHGENPIHDDAVARQHGFRGALVPGVTLYAYLTHPLVRALGTPWLARGTATVRFVRPVVDGEEVTITGAVTRRDASGLTATATARTAAVDSAVMTATLPAGLPTPVNRALYAPAALPAERPPAGRQHLLDLAALGSPETLYDEARAAGYLGSVNEPLDVYRGPDAPVHPAVYLEQANRALDRNVRLGPWLHVSSTVRHLGPARVGERLQTRGKVRSLFERQGREYVELDLLVVAGDAARPVAHVLHTVIYRLATPQWT